jgi:DNA-directed RNA polymerase specialized sigma24 family protein
MFSRTNNKHSAGPPKENKQEYFERVMIPHLNAAYNLARWMTSNEHDAEDVVSRSVFAGLHGG